MQLEAQVELCLQQSYENLCSFRGPDSWCDHLQACPFFPGDASSSILLSTASCSCFARS